MKPGKGPKIDVVEPALTDSNGNPIIGHYDTETKHLQLSGSWVRGLDAAQTNVIVKATGLFLAISTLHEFIHYGRAANGLNSNQLPDGQEAGLRFEQSISQSGDDIINKNNAIKWLNFYKF